MMDVLDRDKLLLALKGQYKSESEKPVFVQELQQDIADQLSSLSVQGFKSLTIPIPKQELGKLKARADRLPSPAQERQLGTERLWCYGAERVKILSRPPLAASHFEDILLPAMMRNAVSQLGLNPDYHSVTAKPHHLFIYDSGQDKPYKLAFDDKPQDAFALMMLQIPVEGGHRGGDLSVTHEQEEMKIERSQHSDKRFYLSASFIVDSPHAISPVREGCSLFLTYYLIWRKPLAVAHHGMSLPTFISSLKTVKEILTPFVSPDGNCDTEMLVIPLSNDYAKTTLNYDNLRGTDKLMANLLQSTNSLEVRLATVVNYRAGIAFDERKMNTNRIDAGYPDSPRQLLEIEEIPTGNSRRFVAQVYKQSCTISNPLLLSGEIQKLNELHPIRWECDYIFKNTIEFIEDLFDDVSPPDKEYYDRYHPVSNNLELQQWWFKPVMIVYPKNSVALKCRNNLNRVLNDLRTSVTLDRNKHDAFKRQAKLVELRKIINFLERKQSYDDENEYDSDDEDAEDDNGSIICGNLLPICNLLEAKEEGISLCRIFAQNVCSLYLEIYFRSDFADFVALVGWESSSKLLIAFDEMNLQYRFLIDIIYQLLRKNSPLRNEAAVPVFNYLLSTLFPSSEPLSNEIFAAKVDEFGDDYASKFFNAVLFLDNHRLLSNADQLVVLATSHLIDSLIAKPISSNSCHHSFVASLNLSSLVTTSSFEKLSERLRSLLVSLCTHFVQFDVHIITSSNAVKIIDWLKLFSFVGHRPLIQELADKICSRPASIKRAGDADKQLIQILKNILSHATTHLNAPNLKAARGQLKRTLHILVKRNRYDIRQSVYLLKSTTKSYTYSIINDDKWHDKNLLQLKRVCDLVIVNNPYIENGKLSEEEAEEEFVTICDLIKMCYRLMSKEKGMRVLTFYFSVYGPENENSIRPEFLSKLAKFIIFADDWANFMSKFVFDNFIHPHFQRKFRTKGLQLSIVLIQQLMRKFKKFNSHVAVIDIFNNLCINIFPSLIHSPHRSDFLSTLDNQHRQIFFHVVLLMEHHNLFTSSPLWIQEARILELVMSHMESISVAHLNHFVALLFEDDDTLTTSPFAKQSNRCQDLLINLCSRFVEYIRFNLSSVSTEDLLNWVELIVYIESPRHLQWLIENLCFNAAPEERDCASLRMLLAVRVYEDDDEEFEDEGEDDSRVKIVKGHPIFCEWKRQQQKKSFAKLFSGHHGSTGRRKRKLSVENSAADGLPKRVQLDNITSE